MKPLEEMSSLNSWFSSLSREMQERLSRNASIRKVCRDTIAHRQGDIPDYMIMIRTGAFWAEKLSSNGNNHVLGVAGPGFIDRVESALLRYPVEFDSYACVDSEYFLIPGVDVRECLKKIPEFSLNVMDLLARRNRILEEAAFVTATSSSLQKMAWALNIVACGYYGLAQPIEKIPISQMKTAENMHMSRQTINKILKELADIGSISIHRENIEILNRSLLEGIARNDEK